MRHVAEKERNCHLTAIKSYEINKNTWDDILNP